MNKVFLNIRKITEIKKGMSINMRSLKQKMLVLFGVLTLIILIGVTAISYQVASNQLEEMYLDQALNETLNAAELFLNYRLNDSEDAPSDVFNITDVGQDTITAALDVLSLQLDRVFTLFDYNGTTFTRRSTSITDDDGQRIVGTELNNQAVENQLLNNEHYLGEAVIANHDYYTAYRPVYNPSGELIGALFAGAPKEDIDQLIASYLEQLLPVFMLVGGVAMVIMLVVVFFVSQSLIGPLNELKEIATQIGKKDLTVTVPTKYQQRKDEIGAISVALMETTTALKTVMQSIQISSDKVADSAHVVNVNTTQTAKASEDVARAMNEVADGAQAQAQGIESGAEQGHLLGEKIDQNAKIVMELMKSNDQVHHAVDVGLTEIGELVSLSKQSERDTHAIAEKIKKTNDSATDISKASQVIASIAEQTNLLALNAAIESARAGEAGKGFAVVANEIRKLAEESTASTADIDDIVMNLQNSTTDAVEKMTDVLANFTKQSEKIQHNKKQYDTISAAIETSKQHVSALKTSGEDMRHYKDDIIAVLENLSSIAEENASSTEEVSASIEEQTAALDEIKSLGDVLLALSEGLNQEVNQFNLDETL